jgi:ribonuclease-3
VISLLKRLAGLGSRIKLKDRELARKLSFLTGSRPYNLHPYKLALRHISAAEINSSGLRESNERLEYLGDAVLGMVIAEHLFKKFPFKDEGFLTEIRSRIVNREALNAIARKMGVHNLVEVEKIGNHRSLYGDSLEAIIGAVYIDKGYIACQRFILKKILDPHFDLAELINSTLNYKSVIIEWAQKENKKARFEIVEVNQNRHFSEFTAQLLIDEKPISTGFGYSKKKAEQDAAKKSCEILNLAQ